MSENTLRVVLVDDEPPARMLLRDYLSAHADVEVIGECANGFEAVKTIAELRPDLVLLDVQMPKLDGFEVLELLDPGPLVVFVTAFDEYAIRAFEVNAVDYLLKPLGRERLAEALGRVRWRRAGGTATRAAGASEARLVPDAAAPSELAAFPVPADATAAAKLRASRLPAGRFLERILVREGSNVVVVPIESVDLLEAQDDYVAIHASGKIHLKTQPLSELVGALDPARFVRVHRSFAVNVAHIVRIELSGKEARIAVLRDGREVPVSRSGYARLREHAAWQEP